MQPLSTFERIAGALAGMKVSHLWRGYGSAIFLEFGELAPRTRHDGSPGNPQGELSIGIQWSWRIEHTTSVICGSWSKEEHWERTFDRLRKSHATALTLFGRLPEIDLALTGDLHLLSFTTTTGQPEWHLADRRSRPSTWLSVRKGVLYEREEAA